MYSHHNSTHSDYDSFASNNIILVKWIHLIRGLIAIIACIPNALVIFLFWKASKRRPSAVRTRLNYAIVNLLIANIIYCTVLCVYSFLKRFTHQTLMLTGPCLTITWFAVFASFEPLWAMALVALARLIYFARNNRLDRLANTRNLALLRLVVFISDLVAASVIIADESDEAVYTHCNYQLMLDNSKRYLAYSLLIVIIIVVLGVTNFIFRIILRHAILSQIHIAEKNSESESKPADQHTVPTLIWQKPKLILIAAVVVTLFLVPRVAFFCDSRPFWLVSTLCPALMAVVLPLAFLWTTREFRAQLRLMLPYWMRRPNSDKRKMEDVESGIKSGSKK